jgi:hypothetical protein
MNFLRLTLLAFGLAAVFPPSGANATEQAAPESVARAAAQYAALEKAEIAKLSKVLDELIADPAFIAPFKERNREKLLAAARPRFNKLKTTQGITHWYFLDPEPARTCFLRVHQPATFGDVVGRATFSQAIATKEIGAGKELGKTAFALRVVKPIKSGGAVIGYMELGEEIGEFLVQMRKQTGDDFALLVDKKRVDRAELAKVAGEDRWDERPDVVLIDSTFWNEKLLNLPTTFDKLPDGGARAGEGAAGEKKYVDGAFPVRDAAGQVVGALYVRHPLPK